MNPKASEFVPSFLRKDPPPSEKPKENPPEKPKQQETPKEKPQAKPEKKVEKPKEKPKEEKPQKDDSSKTSTIDDLKDLPPEELKSELQRMALEEGVSVEDLLTDEDKVQFEMVEEDNREHVNVVFIGHVDAGKSTLCGQILHLMGQVDKRTLEKYEKEAKEKNRETWFLAYIMDTNEDERAKGKTVEVGRAVFETPNKRYTILDAPGHKAYVPNMIGGCAQADVALLVISARKGEFETGFHKGGQTREHAVLAKTLGVKTIIVIINKMDDPTVKWSKERYDEIENSLVPFLKQTGYAKKDMFFVPVSGQWGTNIRDPMPKDVCPWYTGQSLFQLLDELPPVERLPNYPLRLPIVDKIKEAGKLHILGKLEAGTLKVGDHVVVMPNKHPFEVIEIATDNKLMKKAKCGENVRIAVKGGDEDVLRSGFVVCDPKKIIPCQTNFEAQLVIMDLPSHAPLFTAGYSCVIHIHTAVEECTVKLLVAELDKKPPNKIITKRPKFVKVGSLVNCILSCAQPICLELFSDVKQLGRFTLRDESKTIAFGKVISLGPKKAQN